MKLFKLLFFISILSFNSHAITCSSIGNGSWSNPATWSCGVVPSAGDTIIISVGDVVTVSSNINLTSAPTVIIIDGVLLFDSPGAKLRLDCASSVVITATGSIQDSGNGTPSHSIDICGASVWTGGVGTVTGVATFGIPVSLPVELISFEGESNGSMIDFEWSTASERNNDYFTIEGSLDGIKWIVVGEIDGAGVSSEVLDYSFRYNVNEYGKLVYFRLKQTDFDGQFEYFKTISVEEVIQDFNLYPNPMKGSVLNIEVNLENEFNIIITSVSGEQIYSNLYRSSGLISIDINEIKSGIYFVSVISTSGTVSKKLIVNN